MAKACGPVVYELITGSGSPLTDAQADALIHEYANIGMRYEKHIWNGETCLIVRAPATQYELFSEKVSKCWYGIHSRVGIQMLTSRSNTYEPGRSTFLPGKDWPRVEAFIDASYRQEDQQEEQRHMDEIPGLIHDDEISALMNLAQDASAGYDARAKAIQRLGEVGGPRAIDPLMQIYNTELHLIRLDAKDAVDKIRARGK